jgi:hypothetical protein
MISKPANRRVDVRAMADHIPPPPPPPPPPPSTLIKVPEMRAPPSDALQPPAIRV